MEKHKNINLLEEPEVFYMMNNPFDRIVGVLGGENQVGHVVNSDIDLIAITRRGLSKNAVHSLSEVLNISMERISELLHISHRTLQRKNNNEFLSVSITEQLLEIAEIVSEGIAVFGTLENFRGWVHSTPYILNGQKPLDYFDTRFGLQYIKNIMGRIAHGIPS